MCQLIVRMKDNLRPNHPCPHMAYRPGDVVDVLEDGTSSGVKVCLPNFLVVQVDGMTIEQGRLMCVSREGKEVEHDLGDGKIIKEREVVLRREWKFDVNRLPPLAKGIALHTGKLNYKHNGDREKADIEIEMIHKGSGQTARKRGVRLI